MSKGFLNFEKKTYTPHYSKTSLLLPRSIMKKLFKLAPGELSIMANSQADTRRNPLLENRNETSHLKPQNNSQYSHHLENPNKKVHQQELN